VVAATTAWAILAIRLIVPQPILPRGHQGGYAPILTKRYGPTVAVHDLTFNVAAWVTEHRLGSSPDAHGAAGADRGDRAAGGR